jgi:hypothetical protein
MSGGIFVGMDKNIMDGLNAVLEGQSSTYGTMISVIIVSSFTLFILYRGYQTLAGKPGPRLKMSSGMWANVADHHLCVKPMAGWIWR